MPAPPDLAIAQTRRWVESVVIDLGLCPFAREVLDGGRVRFALSHAREPIALLNDLDRELAILVACDPVEIDTTLLVHPRALREFEDFNDFLDPAETLLRERGLEGVVQIASFHPDYRFAGAAADDPANFTNRSPYPVLHLLREESVTRAVDTHPDPLAIPVRNAALMRELGSRSMEDRLRACRTAEPGCRSEDADER